MIIPQKLIQKVNCIIANKALIVGIDERVPRLLGVPAEDIIVLRIKLNLVLVKVVEQVLGTQDLCDLNELISVTAAVEEWLLPEDHGREHGAQGPHVERVVVLLEVD